MFDWIKQRNRSNKVDPETGVRNFGVVEPGAIYRGADPGTVEVYGRLIAKHGIRTILDLRKDQRASIEVYRLAKVLGVTILHAGFADTEDPDPKLVDECVKIISNPELHPVFVHCAGGRHRTGGMIAAFRVRVQKWYAARAYAEAYDHYGFYSFLHTAWERFIKSL